MYAFFEIDGMPDSRQACLDILSQTSVGLVPGIFFGPGSETFLRACVCRNPATLTEAMARLSRALA
jgi:aspartate/methionine/tyrosine aminotransferase